MSADEPEGGERPAARDDAAGDDERQAVRDDRARRAAVLLVVLGGLSAATLVARPPGLGVTVAALAVLAVAAWPRDRWATVWWLGGAALAGVATLRDAGWIVWPSLIAAALLGSAAAAGGAAWWPLLAGLGRVMRLDRGLELVARSLPATTSQRAPLVGAGLAAVLLAVFVPLFATADAAFAHLLGEVVPTLDHPAGRAAAWLGVAATGGGLLWAARAQPVAPLPAAKARLGRVESVVPLAVLVVLFAAFVALQISTLYASHDYVLRTAGLTYAEYAREGFAQLLVAAALTLAVIAAAARWAPGNRLLLGALCLLTLVVLASALTRLGLYMDAYGFTRARLTAEATILWLGGIFTLVIVAGALRRGTHLPRATLALSAAALLAFAISNPDRRIAERNLDRTNRYDAFVLRGLSADAVPALPCNLAERPKPDGLLSFNVARAQARAACAP
jgi:Domain of unknown function (DUF4173)